MEKKFLLFIAGDELNDSWMSENMKDWSLDTAIVTRETDGMYGLVSFVFGDRMIRQYLI